MGRLWTGEGFLYSHSKTFPNPCHMFSKFTRVELPSAVIFCATLKAFLFSFCKSLIIDLILINVLNSQNAVDSPTLIPSLFSLSSCRGQKRWIFIFSLPPKLGYTCDSMSTRYQRQSTVDPTGHFSPLLLQGEKHTKRNFSPSCLYLFFLPLFSKFF